MNAFSRILDKALDDCGWTAANRAFDDMTAACLASDDEAYEAAKARFEKAMQRSAK